MNISQQSPVRLFVCHVFAPSNDYLRVFEYLESSRNFFYRNCSNPELQFGSEDAMKDELRKQINLSEAVIVPAGMYKHNESWIDFQLNCAKGFDKPIVAIEYFGIKAKLPVQLEALADEVIEWNERSIADAIRRQARHEDTARWDVIDFKLD